MLKLFGLTSSEKPLPPDRLQVQHLVAGRGVFTAQSGVPSTADSLAYDAVQRLVAVGTDDGFVKVLGSNGVELLLGASSTDAATQQLLFLANRGGLVRLDKAGKLQLYSLDPATISDSDDAGPLAQLTVEGDQICCLTSLTQEPYLLLGCSSGTIRVAALVNASGDPVIEARQVRNLQLMPYSIAPRKLNAVGSVSSISVLCQPPYQHLLTVHEESGAAVWDLRAQLLVANITPSNSSSSGQITSAAWLHNSSKGDLVTGHAGGDVNVWSLSAANDLAESTSGSWQAAASNKQQQLRPVLLQQLRVVADSKGIRSNSPAGRGAKQSNGNKKKCKAVRALQHVAGQTESVLVLGGGEVDKPDGLVLLPLPQPRLAAGIDDPTTQEDQQQAAAAAAHRLPWLGPICGHALVVPQGSILAQDPPNSILALLEGGQLLVHDISAVTGVAADGSFVAGSKSSTGAAAAASKEEHITADSRSSPTRQRQQQQGSPTKHQEQQQHNPDPAPPQRLLEHRLQGQPLVTAARLRIIPIDGVPLSGLQGACMSSLLDWAASSNASAHSSEADCSWILAGGTPAQPYSNSDSGSRDSYATLYCTGHSDGGVRLWAMHGEAPMFLGKVPSAAAKQALQGRKLAAAAPVSTLEFAWEQGLLVSGHEGGEVRVYQFSEVSKRIDCVLFESVGSRSNNEGMVIQEPPGFQLKLLTRLHTSDIVSSSYLPQFKTVAVSDRSGSVSLVDLAKPAVPWFQAPWANQPVVSLVLGHVPLPALKDRHPALLAAGGAGAAEAAAGSKVRAVVAVAADSQLVVLDAGTGFFLSKAGTLAPKHPSAALHVELLDASGAPTWMSRDVKDLIALTQAQQHKRTSHAGRLQIANHSAGSAVAASAPTAAAGNEDSEGSGARSESAGSGDDDADEESHRPEGEGDDEDEQEQEGEEVDVDDLLAQAAAQVEAQGRGTKAKQTARRSAKTSAGKKDRSIGTSKAARSRSRGRSPNKKSTAGRVAEADDSSSAHSNSPAPDAIVLSEPVAEYVLVATQHYLRLYRVTSAVAGDRTTCKRVNLPGVLQFASSFAAHGAPALVCLLQLDGEVHLQVYTLPSLELVRDMPLSSLLGWSWNWDHRHTSLSRSTSTNLDTTQHHNSSNNKAAAAAVPDAVCNTRLAAVCAATRHGHLALLGPGSELVRLRLAAGAAGVPEPPESVFDWDMATAAHAAVAVMERQQQQAWVAAMSAAAAAAGGGRKAGHVDGSKQRAAEDDDLAVAVAVEGAGGVGPKIDLKAFMNKIGDGLQQAGKGVAGGLQKALDETQKGFQKVAQVIEEEVLLAARPSRAAVPEYPHPTLATLFATAAPGDRTGRQEQQSTARTGSPAKGVNNIQTAAAAHGGSSPTKTRQSKAEGTVGTVTAAAAGASGVYERPASPEGEGAAANTRASGVYDRPPSPPHKPAAGPAAAVSSRPHAAHVNSSHRSAGAASAEEAARTELFTASRDNRPQQGRGQQQQQQQKGGASLQAVGSSSTRVRTADEIRQAYGRTSLQKSTEVRGVMEETRAALAARGERLGQLSEKTADLADSAAGFAELAKQLADKERSKTKWFR